VIAESGVDTANPFETSRAASRVALEAIQSYPVSAVVKAWGIGAVLNLAAPALAVDPRLRALPHPSFDAMPDGGLIARAVTFLAAASPAYVAAMVGGLAFSGLFLILQAYGFVLLARIAPWAAAFAALCVGYFLVVNGPVGSPKYRLPFEPVLIVLAALALCDLRWRLRRR